MPVDRRMDKEVVVHIYNGVLLSHKKERNWVICRDVDGSRDCHTERSKSERKKQISYINAYMWNLEKMVQMNRFAGQKVRHRCREQTYGHQGGKAAAGGGGGGGVMNWEIGIDMHTLMCIKWMTNKNLLYKKIKFKEK